MQAIQTRILPASETRPTRIKAWCNRGAKVFSIPPEFSASEERCHQWAAEALCQHFAQQDHAQYGSDSTSNPWLKRRVSGSLPGGDFAHVFTR